MLIYKSSNHGVSLNVQFFRHVESRSFLAYFKERFPIPRHPPLFEKKVLLQLLFLRHGNDRFIILFLYKKGPLGPSVWPISDVNRSSEAVFDSNLPRHDLSPPKRGRDLPKDWAMQKFQSQSLPSALLEVDQTSRSLILFRQFHLWNLYHSSHYPVSSNMACRKILHLVIWSHEFSYFYVPWTFRDVPIYSHIFPQKFLWFSHEHLHFSGDVPAWPWVSSCKSRSPLASCNFSCASESTGKNRNNGWPDKLIFNQQNNGVL